MPFTGPFILVHFQHLPITYNHFWSVGFTLIFIKISGRDKKDRMRPKSPFSIHPWAMFGWHLKMTWYMIYGARMFVGRVNCSPSLFDNDWGRCERNHSVSTFTFWYFHDHLGPTWEVDCKVVDDSERLGRGSIVQPNKSQKQFPGINAQLHSCTLHTLLHCTAAQLHTLCTTAHCSSTTNKTKAWKVALLWSRPNTLQCRACRTVECRTWIKNTRMPDCKLSFASPLMSQQSDNRNLSHLIKANFG